MHYLILDTCVWVNLAVSEFFLVAKLTRLIEEKKVTVVIPELVRTEWEGCKNTILSQITDEVVKGYRAYNNFISFLNQNNYTDLDESILSFNPSLIGAELSNSRIFAIEQILDSDVAIQLPVSDWSKNMAIEHALQKKAPFRSRNSMADALIFFSAVEWVNTKKPDNSFFVTHNTKDFSDPQMSNNELLAVDLQSFVVNINLGYDIIIGRVFNKIEQFVVTKEEIEQEEADVELIRFKEELSEDSIFGSRISNFFVEQQNREKSLSGVVSKAFEQQKKWQEMLSGGAMNKIFEEQRALQDSIAGAMGKILEEQRKLQETLSGGGVSKLIEEQQKMQDPISGGVMSKVLEEQRKLHENLSGGGVTKLIEEQQKMQDQISGGAMGKILEEQRKLQENLSGCGVSKLIEEQQKIQDQISGGAMGKILEEQRKLQETLSGCGVSKLIEEQQKMQDPLSGGVMSKVLEEQRKLQENLTGCGVSKLIEEHRKIRERLSGGIVNKLLDSNNFDGLY